MKDLEGKELEVGIIYLFPGDATRVVLARFSHETESSYIFKSIRVEQNIGVSARVYSWKRQMAKDTRFNRLIVLRASEEIIRAFVES